jgi:PAS domain S-box-containing protein
MKEEHRDLTKEQLRTAVKALENILQTSLDGILVADRDGAIIRINSAFLDMLGYAAEEILGSNVLFFSYFDSGEYESTTGQAVTIDRDELYRLGIKMTAELFDKGMVCNNEAYFIRKDRKLVPVEGNIALLRNEKGRRTGALAVFRDITERKRAEQKMKQGHEFLENIFKTTADGIFVTDFSGIIIRTNDTFCDMLGYREDELIGTHYSRLYAGDLHAEQSSPVTEQLMEQGYVKNYETAYRKKNGTTFIADVNLSCLSDSRGTVTGAVVAVRDATDRKRMEGALRSSHDELERKVRERTADLEEANTALRVLLKERDRDRRGLEEKMVFNVNKLIMPYIAKLKQCSDNQEQHALVDALESTLSDILSPLIRKLSLDHIHLTPAETRVAGLIRQGKTTREIAAMAKLSERTVERHRDNIRKKIGIKNKKVNLRSYLLQV